MRECFALFGVPSKHDLYFLLARHRGWLIDRLAVHFHFSPEGQHHVAIVGRRHLVDRKRG